MNNLNIFEDGDLSFKNLFKILINQYFLILKVALSISIFIFIVSIFLPEKFNSKIVITYNELKDKNPSSKGGSALAQFAPIDLGLSASSNEEEEAYAILMSRKNIIDFINSNPEIIVYFKSIGVDKNNFNEAEAFYKFNDSISVNRSKLTGITNIYFVANNSLVPASLLNFYINFTNDSIKKDAASRAERKIEYLKEESGKTTLNNINMIFDRLIETELQNKMLANTMEDYAFKVLDPAVNPSGKSGPRVLFNTVLGFFVGLILGCFVALVKKSKVT